MTTSSNTNTTNTTNTKDEQDEEEKQERPLTPVESVSFPSELKFSVLVCFGQKVVLEALFRLVMEENHG